MKRILIALAVLLLLPYSAQAQDSTKNWQYEAQIIAGPGQEVGQKVATDFGAAVYRQFTPHLWVGITGNSVTEQGGVGALLDLGDSELGKGWTVGFDVGGTLDVDGNWNANTGWLHLRARIDRIKSNDLQLAVTLKKMDTPDGPIDLSKNTYIGVGIVKKFGVFPGLGD